MLNAVESTMPSTTQQNMAHHQGVSPMDIAAVAAGASSSGARAVLTLPNDASAAYGNTVVVWLVKENCA